jgi:YD repeat-containing protein
VDYYTDNHIKKIAYSAALNPTANVSFTYDAFFPRRTSMTDGLGTTQFTYHPVGSPGALQPASEDGPYTNDIVKFQYDALGRIQSRSVDSADETFSYDNLDRLVGHQSALGTFNMAYLGQTDQALSRMSSNGLVGTQWGYEDNAQDRRLKAIGNSGQAKTVCCIRCATPVSPPIGSSALAIFKSLRQTTCKNCGEKLN